MWPDVGIKISPKFPKSVIAVFTSKVVISNWPKSQPKFWATFAWIFVAKNIQKSPDLVTLSAAAVVPFSGEKNHPGLLSVKLSLKVVERFKELACLHFPFESPPQTFLLRTFFNVYILLFNPSPSLTLRCTRVKYLGWHLEDLK